MSRTGDREGPRAEVRLVVRCEGCRHLEATYYCIEDGNDYDSGFTYACHVNGAPVRVDDPAQTPQSCPLRATVVAEACRSWAKDGAP